MRKNLVSGQSFNASDMMQFPKEQLDKVDHHHINCVLKSSQLANGDSHEELKAKHSAIKQLKNKMKQRKQYEKKDMEQTKKTEGELKRLLKEQ